MVIHTTILSLGSNCNNGEDLIKRTSDILKTWLSECHFSSIIKNPDVSDGNSPRDYYNMVAMVQTSLPLQTVCSMMKKLENYMGNKKSLREKGIVVMDIDVVEYDKNIIKPNDSERDYYKYLRDEIKQKTKINYV